MSKRLIDDDQFFRAANAPKSEPFAKAIEARVLPIINNQMTALQNMSNKLSRLAKTVIATLPTLNPVDPRVAPAVKPVAAVTTKTRFLKKQVVVKESLATQTSGEHKGFADALQQLTYRSLSIANSAATKPTPLDVNPHLKQGLSAVSAKKEEEEKQEKQKRPPMLR